MAAIRKTLSLITALSALSACNTNEAVKVSAQQKDKIESPIVAVHPQAVESSQSVIEVPATVQAEKLQATPVQEPHAAVQATPKATVEEAHHHEVVSAPAIAPKVINKNDPNRFFISLVTKDKSHPFFGTGDKYGFAIDGVQGGEIVLERGKTYTFEIHSSPLHDVYLSGSDIGWGSAAVESGVKGNFTYDGEMVFTPDQSTPGMLFYQCQNHKSMGGRIFVVNPGESKNIADLHKKHDVPASVTGDTVATVSDQDVKQKLSYAGVVLGSKPAIRVRESANAQAQAMLAEATDLLKRAKEISLAGKNNQAMLMIDDALRKMSAASQMVPSADMQNEQKKRYDELTKSVSELRVTHKEKYAWITKEKGMSAGIKYDEKRVDENVAQAKSSFAKANYDTAIARLVDAEKEVTLAINKMMDSQTVVTKLNIDTPEGEFSYEKERYHGYEELIPVALEQRSPGVAERSLFDGYVNRGKEMYKGALQFAEQKNYPDAIKLMQDASNQIMRGLRLLGINQ